MTVSEVLRTEPGPRAGARATPGPMRAREPVRRRPPALGLLGVVVIALAVLLIAGLSVSALGGHAVPGPSAGRSGVSSGLDCGGQRYETTHLAVAMSGCQALFTVEYAKNFSQNTNATNQYNFSFDIPWVAEISPTGALVRLASPLAPVTTLVNLTQLPGEVILSTLETLNVTNASGTWSPNDTWSGTGAQWNVSNTTVGTTTIGVTFYLFNSSAGAEANTTENTSLSVEFGFAVGPWPWLSSTDSLGFGLESRGAEGSHFVYNQPSRTLQEEWNSTNYTFASIVFGTGAEIEYPNESLSEATVSEQAGVYNAGTPGRESVVLVTFGGVTGGYSFVSYDPWVVFSPGTTVSPPSPPPAGAGWPAWVVLALVLVAAVVAMSTLGVFVMRERRLRREGEELVREMRTAISESAPPRSRSR